MVLLRPAIVSSKGQNKEEVGFGGFRTRPLQLSYVCDMLCRTVKDRLVPRRDHESPNPLLDARCDFAVLLGVRAWRECSLFVPKGARRSCTRDLYSLCVSVHLRSRLVLQTPKVAYLLHGPSALEDTVAQESVHELQPQRTHTRTVRCRCLLETDIDARFIRTPPSRTLNCFLRALYLL